MPFNATALVTMATLQVVLLMSLLFKKTLSKWFSLNRCNRTEKICVKKYVSENKYLISKIVLNKSLKCL